MVKKEEKKEEKKVVAAKDDKEKTLDITLTQIEKQFGKGAIMKLGQDTKIEVEVVPTGALSLDLALGVGGVPRGRVVEVFGPEAGGKTTLTLSIISQVQKKGGVAAFIDAEHALDPNYAKKLGVNLDELLISQPDTGEQALDIAEMLVRSNAVDLIAIDSVAALVPKAEIEGEMGDTHVALQARLMSQALRKLTAIISKTHTCMIFINQIREKIGVMFGSPETTTGGRALKFYSSVRIDLRKIGSIKSGEAVIGARIRAKVVKNKVAPPFRQAEFDIMHDEGSSRSGSILDLGTETGVLEKSGSWLVFGNEKLGQGKEQAREFLKNNAKVSNEIEKRIKEAVVSRDSVKKY
jgi:recombination protein RecA